MSKVMGILTKYGHVTWHKKKISKFLFCPHFTFNIRKVTKFLVEKLSTSEAISQQPPPPPPPTHGALRVKVFYIPNLVVLAGLQSKIESLWKESFKEDPKKFQAGISKFPIRVPELHAWAGLTVTK